MSLADQMAKVELQKLSLRAEELSPAPCEHRILRASFPAWVGGEDEVAVGYLVHDHADQPRPRGDVGDEREVLLVLSLALQALLGQRALLGGTEQGAPLGGTIRRHC